MIRFAMLPLLFLAFAGQDDSAPMPSDAATEASTEAADNAFVLPGDYAQGTSLEDLEARFGKDNVKVTNGPGEGGFYHRVVLFPDDPTRRAYVDFYEDAPLSGVQGIWIRDRESIWRGKHGVRVGMTFAELRKANDKAFYFNGFDGQLFGAVHDSWSPALDDDDGSLGALDAEEGEHMYFNVELGPRAGATKPSAGDYPVEHPSSFSDDPRYPRLGELFEVAAFGATTSLDDEWE